MKVVNIPQPDYPDFAVIGGTFETGYSKMVLKASAEVKGVVKYEATYVGEVDLKEADARKVSNTLRSFGDKRGVLIDIALK